MAMTINTEAARLAVETYFTSEAAEMYCILGGSVVLGLCSVVLWLRFNDQFSIALGITLIILALLFAAAGASLLIRDSKNAQMLQETLRGEDIAAQQSVLTLERQRMQTVADNYQNLRMAFAALALIGALLIVFTHHNISHAIAVGLLIMALAGVVIDKYSEVRTLIYLKHL